MASRDWLDAEGELHSGGLMQNIAIILTLLTPGSSGKCGREHGAWRTLLFDFHFQAFSFQRAAFRKG